MTYNTYCTMTVLFPKIFSGNIISVWNLNMDIFMLTPRKFSKESTTLSRTTFPIDSFTKARFFSAKSFNKQSCISLLLFSIYEYSVQAISNFVKSIHKCCLGDKITANNERVVYQKYLDLITHDLSNFVEWLIASNPMYFKFVNTCKVLRQCLDVTVR